MKPQLFFQRQYLQVLAAFAAKKDVRYYLNGFHIKPHHEQGVILTATDGHRLVTIHDVDGESNGEFTFPISKQLLSASKSRGYASLPFDRIEIVGNTLRVTCLDDWFDEDEWSESTQSIEPIKHMEFIRPIDGNFPDVGRRFKEWDPQAVGSIGFNAKYVGDLAVIAPRKTFPLVPLMFSGEKGAAVAIGGYFREIVAMIMPAKVDDDMDLTIPEFTKFCGHQKQEPTADSKDETPKGGGKEAA